MKATHVFDTGKWVLRKVTMKYGRLAVFISHDSAEIWGFRYGLTLVIVTIKIMASTSVLMGAVCALKRSSRNFPHRQA
jgi:hypothetical protein